MTKHAQYDPSLLPDDLMAALASHAEQLETRLARMLPHITAAYPGFIEAVQHSMRPGGAQGTSGVRTSDISDRTYAEVARRSRGHDELVTIAGLAAEILGATRQLEKLLTSRRREADEHDLEQVRKAIRCQGDPWCQSNALKDGLCGPCAARRDEFGPNTYLAASAPSRGSQGRTGARPKWDALRAAGLANLQAGIDEVREAS